MKTKILILSALILNFLLIGCRENDNDDETTQNSCNYIDHKYYDGTEYYLGEMSNDYLLIGIDTTYSDSQIQMFISNLTQFDQSYNYTIRNYFGSCKFKEIPLKFNNSKTCEEITQIISDIEQNQIVSYAHYTMQTDDCTNNYGDPMGNLCVNSYESGFYVKVFDENDLTNLNRVVSQTNTEILRQVAFMPKWFVLRATKTSNGDALAMANYFYETGLFEASEPEISKFNVE